MLTPDSGEGAAAERTDPDETMADSEGPDEAGRLRPPAPAKIGRYVMLDIVGTGGMGVVSIAYDPKLDRKIALKLLRPRGTEGPTPAQQARLLREAKSLAKLAHPNVITVHDVDVQDGQLYIAMEYVDGQSLREWLKAGTRTWKEVVDVFVRAGRGLAAAHGAGILHRDFKPANVLIGNDGRVRVVDFGLAKELDAEGADDDESDPDRQVDPVAIHDLNLRTVDDVEELIQSASEHTLTQHGKAVGTPPYMSPEQHLGLRVTQHSDQFSFCVSLYQGLYGTMPFAADEAEEMFARIVSGRVAEPADTRGVPARVHRVLLRGLRPATEERFPTMEALLAELQRDPARRWRAVGIGAALVAAAGGVTFVAMQGQSAGAVVCEGAELKLAGVWDQQRRGAVRDGLLGTQTVYAQETWDRVEVLMDDYTSRWTKMRTEACEATHVLGEQSEAMLDLRMACLDRRLAHVDALADVLATADSGVVLKAVQAASGLPRLERCADTAALTMAVALPDDPATRARVSELRTRLARADALEDAGRWKDGVTLAGEVVAAARELGYRPLEAEALYHHGTLQGRLGENEEAEKSYIAAELAAVATNYREVAARSSAHLVIPVGTRLGRLDDGKAWEGRARAELDAAGNDPELEKILVNAVGQLRVREGRDAEALAAFDRLHELVADLYGPRHILIAVALSNRAHGLAQLGRLAEAREMAEQAHAIRKELLSASHPDVGLSQANLARSLLREGNYEDAVAQLQGALAIYARSLEADHFLIGSALVALGGAYNETGDVDEGEAALQRALEIHERKYGADHPRYATVLNGLGELRLTGKDHAGSLEMFQRAQSIRDAKLPPEHSHHSYSLTGIGKAMLGLGKPTEAIAPLSRALEIRTKKTSRVGRLGETRFHLARALWKKSSERARALELARQAREDLAGDGPRWQRELRRVDAWLATRPSGTPSR